MKNFESNRQYEATDRPLFDARRFLGRTVYIIDNIIQADFTPPEDDEPEAA